MSRGRKVISEFENSDWSTVFYNSVGTYVQYINQALAKEYSLEPLSNHIKIAGGYAFKNAQYKNQGIPIIRISDFNNEKIILEDVVYYAESEDLKRYELVAGDIVIALTGGTIAKLAIVQEGLGKLYLNQRVGKFEVLNPEEFETEYVYWIARSVQNIIKNLAWGAAIPNVSPKTIEAIEFPFPSKQIQQGIIAFLNDLKNRTIVEERIYFDEEIENKIIELQENQLNGSLLVKELLNQLLYIEQIRNSILKDAVQGKLLPQIENDDSVNDLLVKIKREKEEHKKKAELNLINKAEVPFAIPANWEWCRLGDLRDFKYTLSYGVLVPGNDIPNGVPFVRVQDMDSSNKNELPSKHIAIGIEKKYAKTRLVGGEILICVVGSIGKVALSSDKWIGANIARAICRFMPNKNVSRKYIYYCLLSPFTQEFFHKSKKSINPTLNVNILETTLIPLPPLAEQNRIVNKIEMLNELCDYFERSVKECKAYTEELLNTLLNEAIGQKSTDLKPVLKEKVKKFYISENIFEKMNMKIIEILQTSKEPISSTVVWNSSEFSDDIEKFYAELKQLVDVKKLVVEEKRGKESFLKLAANEN